MKTQRGFTLVEMLLSLSICLMIVLNVPSIIRVLKVPVVSYNQDIAVG
ncbi:prepilin-type N-terminal cleavage/methylation domain-containing protein, partial [Catenibacterium sp.]